MSKPLSERTLGIIHANNITIRAMQPFIEKYIPDVSIMHLVDDTIQRDNIAAGVGVIPKRNYFKFAQYAHNLEEAGVDLILLACSTFNLAAELARPMIDVPIAQIDRPMMELAVSTGRKIGLLATLNTTVPSSERLLRIAAAGVGVIPKRNYFKFAQYAHNLEEAGADLILLACSTFNFAAELARPMINVPIAQIDRPMMELAVSTGRKIGLLATLNTTVPSSERLLRIAAAEKGKEIEVTTVLCEPAFAAISKGDAATHNAILLEEVEKLSKSVDCIAMAQLSMSALAPHLTNTRVPVYNSGDTGFMRVREMLLAL